MHLSFPSRLLFRGLVNGKNPRGFRCSGLNLDGSFAILGFNLILVLEPFYLEPFDPWTEPFYLFVSRLAGLATAAFCN